MKSLVRLTIFGAILIAPGCKDGEALLKNPGVSLPEEQETPVFSEKAVDLNDQAIELFDKNNEEAMALLDRAIEQQPDYHVAYANKATLLIGQKHYAEAAMCFEQAAKLRPHCAEYYVGLAFALARSGKPEPAKRWCRYAIAAYNLRLQKNPNNPFTRLNRAVVMFLLGYKNVTLREIESILRDNADFTMAEMMRKEIEQADENDRWKVLGLD